MIYNSNFILCWVPYPVGVFVSGSGAEINACADFGIEFGSAVVAFYECVDRTAPSFEL